MDKLPPKGYSSAVVLEQVHQPRTTSNSLRTLTVPTPASLGSSAAGQESSAAGQGSLELGFRFAPREGLVSAENTAGQTLQNYRDIKRRNKPQLLGSEVETPFSSSPPLPDRLDSKAGLLGDPGVEPLRGVPRRFPLVRGSDGVEHDRLYINLLRNLRFLLGDEARSEDDGFGAKLKLLDFGYRPSKNPKLLLDLKFPPGALGVRGGYTGSYTIKGIVKYLRLDDVKATTDESRPHDVNLGNITLTYFLDETQDIKFEAIFNPFTKIIFIRIFKKKLEGGYTQMYESEYRLDQPSKQIFFRPYTEELAQIPFPIVKERFMGKPKKFVNPYVLIAQHFGTKKSFEDVEKGRENFLKKLLLNNVLDATQRAMLASMLATDESVKERNSELFRLYELYKTGTKERPIKDILSFDEEFTTTQWASPKLTPNSVKAFQRFGKLDPRIVLVKKKEKQQLIVREIEMLAGDVELESLTKALTGSSNKFVQREVEFYAPTKFGYKRPFTLTDILKSRYYSNYLFEELGITEAILLQWFSGIEEFRSDVFLTVSLFCHFIDPDNSGFVDMDKPAGQREFKPHTSLSLFKSYPAQFKQYLPNPTRVVQCLQFFEKRKFATGDAQKNMLGGVFGTDVSECPVSAISPKREFEYCKVFEALADEDCRLETALGQNGLEGSARAIFNELITGLKAPTEVVQVVEDDIEERLEALKEAQFPSLDGLSVAKGLRSTGSTLPPLNLRGSFAAVATTAARASDLLPGLVGTASDLLPRSTSSLLPSLVGRASDLLPGPVGTASDLLPGPVGRSTSSLLPGPVGRSTSSLLPGPAAPNPEQMKQLQLIEKDLREGNSNLQQTLITLEDTQRQLSEGLRKKSRRNEGGAEPSDRDLAELYFNVDKLSQKIQEWRQFISRKEGKLLELRASLPTLSPSLLLSRGPTTATPPKPQCVGEECGWETTTRFKKVRSAEVRSAPTSTGRSVPLVRPPANLLPSKLPETEEDYGEASSVGPQRKVVGSSKAKGFIAPNAAKELLTKQNLQMLISDLEASTNQEFDKKLLRLITDGRNEPKIREMLYQQIFGSGNEVFEPEVKTKLRKLFVGTLRERKEAMLQILAKINIEEYDLVREKKFRAEKNLGKKPIPESLQKEFDTCCKLPRFSELKVQNIPKDPETPEFELEEDSSSPSFKIVKAFLDWFSNKLDELTREARRVGLAEEDLLLIKSVFRNASLIQGMVRKIINSEDSNLSPEERQLKDDLLNEDETKKRNAIFFIAKNNLGLLGQKFKESELGQRKKEKEAQVKEEQGKENELRDKLLGVEAAIEENIRKQAELKSKYAEKDAEVDKLDAENKTLKKDIDKLKRKKSKTEEEKGELLKKEQELEGKAALLGQEQTSKVVLNSEKTRAINEGKPLLEEKKRLLEELKPFDSVNAQKGKVFEARTSGRTKNDDVVSLLTTFEAINSQLETNLNRLTRLKGKKSGIQEATSIKEEANGEFPIGIAEKLIEELGKSKTLDLQTKAKISKLKVLICKYKILKTKININFDEKYESKDPTAIESEKQKLKSLETELVAFETAELTAQAAYESKKEEEELQVDVDEGEGNEEDEFISININEGGASGGRNININGFFRDLSSQDRALVKALRVEMGDPKYGIRKKYLSTREEHFRVKYEKYKLKYLSLKSKYFR